MTSSDTITDDLILINDLKLLHLDSTEIKKIVKMSKDLEYNKIYKGRRPIDITIPPKHMKKKPSSEDYSDNFCSESSPEIIEGADDDKSLCDTIQLDIKKTAIIKKKTNKILKKSHPLGITSKFLE